MSQSIGPYTDRYGFVFGYDTSDISNSFKGEPTVNLSYNNGQGGSEYLAAPISWVNAGSWEYNDNETDVPKPFVPGVDTTNLRILSGKSTAADGSVHFGCGFTYLSPSTTYTVSVWYRQSRAGTSQPYLRTNITNVGLANLAYNGNTDSSTWPVNQWIRISASGTTASNENGLYISNYFGQYFNDKIWYFGHQVEQKSYMTPLVIGTRGINTGLYNIADNTNITLTNVSYNSSGNIIFDGSDDNMDADVQLTYGNCSIEMVCKWTSGISDLFAAGSGTMGDGLSGGTYLMARATSSKMWIGMYSPQILGGGWYNLDGSSHAATVSLSSNTLYHIVLVNNQSTWLFYVNGSLAGSVNHNYLSNTGATRLGLFRNHVQNVGNAGEIKAFKVYNIQTLNSTDVSINYNNYKKRFGI